MTKNQKLTFGLLRATLVGLTAVAAVFAGAVASEAAPTVTTPSGTYQGVAETGITAFLSIQYAAAPTGPLRFAPPTAPPSLSGTIAATAFGSSCPQTPSPFNDLPTDEDCLFLNVFVPGNSVSASKNLPVMVFFHGGSFVYGTGSLYDPTVMVIQGNTIVVTVNYRLGILGYMAEAALSAGANGVSGNYGFQDQLFALKWVQQNIGAFGGNPQKVTIFGESAPVRSASAPPWSRPPARASSSARSARAALAPFRCRRRQEPKRWGRRSSARSAVAGRPTTRPSPVCALLRSPRSSPSKAMYYLLPVSALSRTSFPMLTAS